MTEKIHEYGIELKWTGNLGTGTSHYTSYSRNFETWSEKKPILLGSSDPAFRGDKTRYNPEEFLVSSISSCHMLWYLHLCADAGVTVCSYHDQALGKMIETADGSGKFSEVILRPKITVATEEQVSLALELHLDAHKSCFLANSVNFPIVVEPTVSCEPRPAL